MSNLWSWWPVLTVPFPYMPNGVQIDLTPVNDFLELCGNAVGLLVLFVAAFLIIRRLLVSFSGGD